MINAILYAPRDERSEFYGVTHPPVEERVAALRGTEI